MAKVRRETLESLVEAIKDFYESPYEEEACKEKLGRINLLSRECLADVSLGIGDRVTLPMALRDFICALYDFGCEDFETAVTLLGFEVV